MLLQLPFYPSHCAMNIQKLYALDMGCQHQSTTGAQPKVMIITKSDYLLNVRSISLILPLSHYSVLSYLIFLSYLILPYLILLYLILPYLISSYLTLPYLTLPYLILSYLTTISLPSHVIFSYLLIFYDVPQIAVLTLHQSY